VPLSGNRDHNLIEVPTITGSWRSSADAVGILPTKLLGPTTNSFVTDLNPAGGEHLLDHAQAQRKAVVEPDCKADHLGRETVAGIE
jgi:hypothetical protein